ncbi:DUF1501 domain-containing protein [Pedobacter aquatilis]|uniref:DUF1501 domain-containing protein n=1 Tax=Pedobacter aquatilis TaxID=351343 RepID=UPI0025B3197B|nr:DUF1501 domain-containing protein [Pedobacter aquatilis]MDN3585503.1 DUF1501 domain-containing protein [Pedobacter aquatilis]
MKRREFLKKAMPAGVVLPSLIGGFSLKAFGASSLLSAITAANQETDHVLVIIQLNGGNDGLNMILPLDQYDNLTLARPNIILPKNKIIKLSGYNTGIHPSMSGLAGLYDDGKVQVIQSVGYPQPNFSHFRATDIWLSASDSDQTIESGWAGRYLSEEYTNFPIGYPNTVMPDPLAIQIGSFISPAFQGPSVNMGMAISDPVNFYNLINGIQSPAPNSNAGKELTYIRQVSQQTQQYASVIKTAAGKVTKQGTYPTNNSLADQLKVVARLVAGGLKTRLYMVNIGSFDTHAAQVNTGSTETGTHAVLLQRVSDAIKAFMDDLKGLGASKRVAGMTFSEFGRRIKSNASNGTDHGAAAPLIVFGDAIQGGVLGKNPTISATTSVNDNIPMQYDFRSVYATLLEKWFCVDKATLSNVMLKDFQPLPLIQPGTNCMSTSLAQTNRLSGESLISNYPNPFTTNTTIKYTSKGGHVLIQVFNTMGKLMATVVDAVKDEGTYNITFENQRYAPGIYYARLQNGELQQVRNMLIVS